VEGEPAEVGCGRGPRGSAARGAEAEEVMSLSASTRTGKDSVSPAAPIRKVARALGMAVLEFFPPLG
jgi:hypothetical protein